MEIIASRVVDSLAGFLDVLPALVAATDDSDASWRPADGGWSILDVMGHLADEEVVDFRPRLDSLLRDASLPWASIDPPRRVEDARASLGNLADECERFVSARRESIAWLRELDDPDCDPDCGPDRVPDWGLAYAHPQLGPIRAGDLLVSWAAHDVLHARQILRRQYELLHVMAPEFSSAYAGPLS